MAYYSEHAQQLKRDLAAEVPTDELRTLHAKRPLLHALIAFLNVAALVAAGVAIVHFDRWYFWLPFAFVAGFAVFDFTVLLHEVVHRAVLTESSERGYRVLGLLYAVPSGISASQFTRWHLDHHLGLGSDVDDPKRQAVISAVARLSAEFGAVCCWRRNARYCIGGSSTWAGPRRSVSSLFQCANRLQELRELPN